MGAKVWGLRIGAQSEAREGTAKTRNSLKSPLPHRNPATAQCSGGGHAEMPQVYCFPATITPAGVDEKPLWQSTGLHIGGCDGFGFKSVVLLCAFNRGGVNSSPHFVCIALHCKTLQTGDHFATNLQVGNGFLK